MNAWARRAYAGNAMKAFSRAMTRKAKTELSRFQKRAHARRARSLTALALVLATLSAANPAAANSLPPGILRVIHDPRYASAKWNLLVTDLQTGKSVYGLAPDRLAFTGSVRKLFSVGVALNALGPGYRFDTPVYRRGPVDARGSLQGDLILVGAGDLTFGGRLDNDGGIAYTDFDHGDANSLGTALLTPQDPLHGLDVLAREVRASGIRSVRGKIVIDDGLFQSYRVPNRDQLIDPVILNENLIDVWAQPTQPGKTALVDWRPKSARFTVRANVRTIIKGKDADIALSHDGTLPCDWSAFCLATMIGVLPVGYAAPLSASPTFVRTFTIDDPVGFTRIAFSEALERAGVSVQTRSLSNARRERSPRADGRTARVRIADFISPPYAQYARLILKVSLNLGANLSLSLFGLTHGQRTIAGALAAERRTLISQMGVAANEFSFPTNGSGSPDSEAAARAVVQMLSAMSRRHTYAPYRASLPILGVDGSLAGIGKSLPARGHVFAKTGTTVDASGLKAQTLAGYIDAKSGRHFAFALFVNDVGPIKGIADVARVIEDEAKITNAIYESQ